VVNRNAGRWGVFVGIVGILVSSVASAQLAVPVKEHELLARLAGDWNVVMYVMGQEIAGTEHNELIAGGLWLTTSFEADMAGQVFEGHGVTGFDTQKKKYVSTWVDPSRTDIMFMEATLKGTARVGTTMMMGMTGEKVETRVVEDMPTNDKRILTFHQKGSDGKELEIMRMVYTRAK
jgi:hypothetical protein